MADVKPRIAKPNLDALADAPPSCIASSSNAHATWTYEIEVDTARETLLDKPPDLVLYGFGRINRIGRCTP